MTIRELLKRCSFEDIMLHIGNIQREQLAMRPYYREARDILLHIEAKDTFDGIPVVNRKGRPWAIMCEGNPWCSLVDSPLEIEDGLHCPEAQLAAQCLWHLTFYRFAPDAPSSLVHVEEPSTRRGRITQFLTSLGTDTPEKLQYLYKTYRFTVQTYQSRAYDISRRIMYLVETMNDYALPSRHPAWDIAFVLIVDPRHPLTEAEMAMYHDLVEKVSANRRLVTCCIGKNDGLGTEAKLLVIESKSREGTRGKKRQYDIQSNSKKQQEQQRHPRGARYER